MKQSNISKKVEEMCRKYTKTPTLTLAKKIYNENQEAFKNLEQARNLVRLYRGQIKSNIKKEKITPPAVKLSLSPFKLPESKTEPRKPYVLRAGKWLILNDIHFPYHCISSLDLALNFGLKNGFNNLLLNGDILDMYKISRFETDPRKPSINAEFEMVRDFLKQCVKHFNQVIFKIGNHEDRWERWLIAKAPELLDCEDFELKILLRFGELGISLVESKQLIKAGHLTIAHGHEIKASAGGVNPARSMFLKANSNIAVGHFHRTSSHVERNIKNEIIATHSIGCLCDLSPDYLPYNNWNNGFATVELDKSGDFHFENKKIIKNNIF